jgi:hypothetical protein
MKRIITMNEYQVLAINLITRIPYGGSRVFLTSDIPDHVRVICYNLNGQEISINELTTIIQDIVLKNQLGRFNIHEIPNGVGYIIELLN